MSRTDQGRPHVQGSVESLNHCQYSIIIVIKLIPEQGVEVKSTPRSTGVVAVSTTNHLHTKILPCVIHPCDLEWKVKIQETAGTSSKGRKGGGFLGLSPSDITHLVGPGSYPLQN